MEEVVLLRRAGSAVRVVVVLRGMSGRVGEGGDVAAALCNGGGHVLITR